MSNETDKPDIEGMRRSARLAEARKKDGGKVVLPKKPRKRIPKKIRSKSMPVSVSVATEINSESDRELDEAEC